MPIYEFRCDACHNKFEDLVSSRQQNKPVTCPECESHNVSRLFSVFGVGASDTTSVPTMDAPMCGTCGRQTPQPCSSLR